MKTIMACVAICLVVSSGMAEEVQLPVDGKTVAVRKTLPHRKITENSEATEVPPLGHAHVAAIERRFGGPLAVLRRATERYAASGDASALQSAEDDIRQPGVLRACIIKVGQTTMPALSFAEIVGGEESQTRGERSITEGTVALKGGEVVSVVSYHAAVTNAAGQEIFYTLTVRRDSLGKP